jgi:putative serine/threonine protein kinase
MESGRLSATHSESAHLDLLTKTPYIQVLTYPRISLTAARSRIRQLERLGVEVLIFEGKAKVGRLGILGLGTVGVVVSARVGEDVRAVKIRRTDANRPNMEEEARITSMANRLDIGPTIYGHTRDLMLMKLLKCVELEEWLRGLSGQGARMAARAMVHSILNQCRKLDIMGIDHGQLSNLRKHAVVAEGVPWIIDFESAGTSRKPKNVTTAAQYLFIGGRLSPRLRRMIGIRDTSPLLRLLSEYKNDTSDYTYSKIIETLRLAPG